MKLFVIGATGRTGLEIVHQALARGHHVTAFVRSPESITLRNERLTVLKGNVTDENQLFNAMQSHDAVLSALGPREVFVGHPAENALVPDIGRKPIDAISSFVTGETS
jgi:putative NADH-flavin reductase